MIIKTKMWKVELGQIISMILLTVINLVDDQDYFDMIQCRYFNAIVASIMMVFYLNKAVNR